MEYLSTPAPAPRAEYLYAYTGALSGASDAWNPTMSVSQLGSFSISSVPSTRNATSREQNTGQFKARETLRMRVAGLVCNKVVISFG